MTLLDLFIQSRQEDREITSLAYDYWDYLDESAQRAIGKELCSLFGIEKDNNDLIFNLFEYHSEQFAEYFISQVIDLINGGEGQDILLDKDMQDLFHFIVSVTSEKDFNDFENDFIERIMKEIDISIREQDYDGYDYNYYTTTCDFINLLEKILSILADL